MITLFLSIILSLFIFKNSLYFTIALLAISFIVLIYLALYTYLTFLTVFILIIVYVGAMIVLIGYICAVSPNLMLEPNYGTLYYSIVLLLAYTLFDQFNTSFFNSTTVSLVDFFYSYQGLFLFSFLVLILFVTLLIVTCQYTVPNGPFRSVKV